MPAMLKISLAVFLGILMAASFWKEGAFYHAWWHGQQRSLENSIASYGVVYQMVHHAKKIEAQSVVIQGIQKQCGESCQRTDPLQRFSKVVFLAREEGVDVLQTQGSGDARSLEISATLPAMIHFLKTLNRNIHFVKIVRIEKNNEKMQVDLHLF